MHRLNLPLVTDTCGGHAAHALCKKMRFILHAKVVRIPTKMEKLKRPLVKGGLQGLHAMVPEDKGNLCISVAFSMLSVCLQTRGVTYAPYSFNTLP